MDEVQRNENLINNEAIPVPTNTERVALPSTKEIETSPTPDDEETRKGLQQEIVALGSSVNNTSNVDEKGYIKVAQLPGVLGNPFAGTANSFLEKISK